MDIKYYDLLSTAIVGVATVAVLNYLFLGNIGIDGVVYLAFGYLVGYFINAIGSFLEGVYYKSIDGEPSDKLLTVEAGQDWTGYGRVKFYQAKTMIKMLKKELGDDASKGKMFECAMRRVNNCDNSRVPTFNAQYALSRTILTAVLIADVLFASRFYDKCLFWFIAVTLLVISWNRFKERGYYYAREVLNEYLNQTCKTQGVSEQIECCSNAVDQTR